jgi:hypothetical protein
VGDRFQRQLLARAEVSPSSSPLLARLLGSAPEIALIDGVSFLSFSLHIAAQCLATELCFCSVLSALCFFIPISQHLKSLISSRRLIERVRCTRKGQDECTKQAGPFNSSRVRADGGGKESLVSSLQRGKHSARLMTWLQLLACRSGDRALGHQGGKIRNARAT